MQPPFPTPTPRRALVYLLWQCPPSTQLPHHTAAKTAGLGTVTGNAIDVDHVVMGTDGQVQPIYKDSHSERGRARDESRSGVEVAPHLGCTGPLIAARHCHR